LPPKKQGKREKKGGSSKKQRKKPKKRQQENAEKKPQVAEHMSETSGEPEGTYTCKKLLGQRSKVLHKIELSAAKHLLGTESRNSRLPILNRVSTVMKHSMQISRSSVRFVTIGPTVKALGVDDRVFNFIYEACE
jgi:hypothetical protein